MSSLQIGRLLLGPPFQWQEQLGDPVTSIGGAIIPQPRAALRHAVDIGTLAADGATDTLAARLVLRRQLRSLLNNTQLKLQGGYYVLYSDDSENSGWYVPDQGQFADGEGASGLATGWWKLANLVWFMAGHRRTAREARLIWMKDLRSGLFQRDYLNWIYSADFSALPTLQLTVVPSGAVQIANTVTNQVSPGTALPTGRDGGVAQQLAGLVDLAVVSYERPESAFNLSDVIAYDRRGQITAPSAGPDTSWEELYGPDYPFNWVTDGQPNDTPLLDNGLVRIRYDASVGVPGFRVDVWTGSAYVEQGKMVVQRIGDSTGYCDTWVSASVMEYSPDRTIISCVLRNSADSFSRERVFITLQRGELGATFECYPGIKSTLAQADVALQWTPALNAGVGDLNNSASKVDSQGTGSWTPGAAGTAVNVATAGTGAGTGHSGQFGALAALGNANFTSSENWIAVLRCPTAFGAIGAYQTTLAVVQGAGALAKYGGSSTTAYGVASDTYQILSQSAAGYIQIQLYFAPAQTDQVLEAESATLGTGTTAAAEAAASGTGNNSTSTTRTTDANAHITKATWPNGFLGTYRVFVRVRCTASTLNVYAKTGATTGVTVTSASTSYVWLDLGEITANNTSLEIHLWATAAATCWLDRVEAYLVQDRARTNFIYSGARDFAQAALTDSRASGCLVAR